MASYPRQRDPRVKIEWANKHIRYLTKRENRFIKRGYEITEEPDSKNVPRVDFKCPLDPDIPCLIGDIIHNLRGALDHLVFRLLPPPLSDRDLKRRGFPVGRDANDFKSAKARNVEVLHKTLVTRIDDLEPYQGGKGHAIWQLHELNIIDKHRLLLTVGLAQRHVWKLHNFSPANIGVHGFGQRRSRLIPLQDGAPLPVPPPFSEMDVREEPSISIAFNEPTIIKPESVIPALIQFSDLVESIVKIFDDIP